MKFTQHEEIAKQYEIGTGSQFWRPEKGENKVRILSEFGVYSSHWVKKDNRSYVCIGKDNGCPYCKAGNKPKARFLFWVLDRKDGQIKIAQTGYSVIKQLGELGKSDDWGFDVMPEYDVVIKKVGEGLDTEYFVTPTPNKKKLSKEEQEAVMKTLKPIEDIIEKMKEKAGKPAEEVGFPDDSKQEDVNIEDIPF